ncbi:MAG: hypothetical protein WCC06_11115 [Candidatus Aminicenantales bacterium]
MKDKILHFNLYFGLGVFAVAVISLALQFPFMKTWFFCFAWWSLILILDSVNFRRMQTSLLARPIGYVLSTALFSVFIWLIFELFNLRLNNWTYHRLPQSILARWLGYLVAFASVIPALQELAQLFQSFFRQSTGFFRICVTSGLLRVSLLLGGASIILALLWPEIFFPLTWLCFILLFEPLNFIHKNASLLDDLERPDARRLYSWLLSGFTAGLLWELFNFWAGSHWEYHLHYFDFLKVFQMPLFGYGGFLFFGLECFVVLSVFDSLSRKRKIQASGKIIVLLGLCIFYSACFFLIDTLTWVR